MIIMQHHSVEQHITREPPGFEPALHWRENPCVHGASGFHPTKAPDVGFLYASAHFMIFHCIRDHASIYKPSLYMCIPGTPLSRVTRVI
ncbi:hypothetical protein K439DRAFT_1639697 [Ramaria rubella]|nr:hypothetical protein K439DRAFT_1639694 [Ramaria rubella]KAF8577483.1 hypothetical protein K439DRAFT_1639697 [Ramaria rubella]